MPILFAVPFMLVVAAYVAHAAHKSSATAHVPAHHVELDQGMPDALVQEVLSALAHESDPSKLTALAQSLVAQHFPLAAGEVQTKAVALTQPRTGADAAPRPATPDMSEAAVILQTAMRAQVQERDPVELQTFAASIRDRFPSAAVLLATRAHDLSAAAAAVGAGASPSPSPQVATPPPATTAGTPPLTGGVTFPSSLPLASAMAPASALHALAAQAAATAATYQVHAGDTPSVIAEKLAHDAKRWPELIAANPSKPKAVDGSFASLRPGEVLAIPTSWTSHATSPSLATEAHPS